jgi:ribosomal protein S18 acetylase RimI-like enzyme
VPVSRYTIETLDLADFAEVTRLWRKTEGVGLNEADKRPKLAIYLKRNPGMSFVARQGGRIVGAVLCGHDGRRGYLQHLAVARAHRGRGIARRLVQACLRRLASDGITRCNIYLFVDNSAGELFWKHNGWAERSDLRVMQRRIPPRK